MMWFRWVELEQLSFCRGARLENWINRWKPYKYDFKRMKLDKNWIRINYPWKPLQAAICKTWIWRTHEYANYVNFVFICIVNLWPNTHGSGLSCINFHNRKKLHSSIFGVPRLLNISVFLSMVLKQHFWTQKSDWVAGMYTGWDKVGKTTHFQVFFQIFFSTQIPTGWPTRQDWGGGGRWSAFEARRHLLL